MPPVHDLAHALRDYGNDVHGLTPRAATVVLVFDEKHRQEVQIPEWLMRGIVAPPVLADEPISAEDAILRVIATMAPGSLMSGSEIADRAGRTHSGSFRGTLSQMADAGRIRKGEGRTGFGPI